MYRRPTVFQIDLEQLGRGQRFAAAVRMYLHGLPYVVVVAVLGRLLVFGAFGIVFVHDPTDLDAARNFKRVLQKGFVVMDSVESVAGAVVAGSTPRASSAFRICARSAASRVSIGGGPGGPLGAASKIPASKPSSAPRVRITARSITCCSSRTFPGQSWASRAFKACAGIAAMDLPYWV